jgi:hypothetical protein
MQSKIKSFFKWVLISLLILLIGGTAALFIFKDRIIHQVIVEVNKNLSVPIQVSKVDLDFFYGFPNVSIAFNDVILPADAAITFLEAKRLYAVINPIQILRGNLNIDRVEVIEAMVNIYIDDENHNNVSEIFNSQTNAADSSAIDEAQFNLGSVLLKNSELIYHNDFSGSRERWFVEEIEGSLSLNVDIYSSRVLGKLSILEYATRNWQSKKARDLEIDLNIIYNAANNKVSIDKSLIKHKEASFLLDGELSFLNTPEVNLNIDGENISFALVTGFLPPKFENTLKKYEGSGSIDFNTKVIGQVSSTKLPSLDAELKLINVTLTDKSFNANIDDLYLTADLHFDDIGRLATGSLKVKEANGLLENNKFELSIAVENFISPKYEGYFKGNIATNWLLANLKFHHYKSGSGSIDVELSASGKFDKAGNLNQSNLGGTFNLNDISFQWADTISIDKIDGLVQFEGDNTSLTNLQLKWLNSDVIINGFMEDIRPTWGNPIGNVLLKSEVRSNKLAVEDIVGLIRNAPKVSDSSTSINYKLDLELVYLIDHLSFRRYKGEDISGEVTLQDNLLEVVDLTGKGIGGEMKLNGKLKFMPNKDIYISANALTKGVYLDSLFYVFNNFDQEFITDKNLKGLLYADVFASMYFDSTWRFRRPLLTSMAKIRVIGGELDDFKPIMALSTYIDDKDDNLSNLKFSHIVNHITIREDTIHIPEMSIQTNVRNIALGGYHTLNQHINYQLAVPVINEKVDKDEAFGAIQKSSKGSPNLLFRIKGTTTDYKVNYDLLRATGNVLKLLDITKIFKKKEDIPVDSTFLNDDEFDWKN